MNRWLRFISERFSPLIYIPTIVLLCGSILSLSNIDFSFDQALFIFSIITIFLFKLRIYDEIKDYDTDIEINPSRPLPRGLISLKETKIAFKVCIVLEVLLFIFSESFEAISCLLFAILYSLLMYKEFFLGSYLRDKLTTYAVVHTVVISFLSLSCYCYLFKTSFLELETRYYFYALLNWPIFNLFEFARKTFSKDEEKAGVDSYSSLFSPMGAFVLSLSQLGLFSFFVTYYLLVSKISLAFLWINFSVFIFIGLYYVFSKNKMRSKLFRAYSSFLLLVLYLTLCDNLIFGVAI